MSVYQDRTLTCPHCQHKASHSVAVSLNAARAARQRAAIFDGTFQRFTCTQCGKTYRADGPFIYIDFDAKHWVGVFPEPAERAWWSYEREPQLAFERNLLEHAPAMVREWAPGFLVRAVFGIPALREKLVAWEAGLDDRELEAHKLALLRNLGPFDLGASCRPRLHAASASSLTYHVPRPTAGDPGRLAVVSVPRAELLRIAEHREEWQPVIASLSEGPYVDLGRLFIPRIEEQIEEQPEEPASPEPSAPSG